MAILYASISDLNLMRAITGSQCREMKRGLTWALLGSLKTGRATAHCTLPLQFMRVLIRLCRQLKAHYNDLNGLLINVRLVD